MNADLLNSIYKKASTNINRKQREHCKKRGGGLVEPLQEISKHYYSWSRDI